MRGIWHSLEQSGEEGLRSGVSGLALLPCLDFLFSSVFTTFQNSISRYFLSVCFTPDIVLELGLQTGVKVSLRDPLLLQTENQVLLVLVVTPICIQFFGCLSQSYSSHFLGSSHMWRLRAGIPLYCPVPYCTELSSFFIYPKCSLHLL